VPKVQPNIYHGTMYKKVHRCEKQENTERAPPARFLTARFRNVFFAGVSKEGASEKASSAPSTQRTKTLRGPSSSRIGADLGINPIVTLEKQLLNMIGNLV
jgi:hypothetical protein